jgi:hypothetical protein
MLKAQKMTLRPRNFFYRNFYFEIEGVMTRTTRPPFSVGHLPLLQKMKTWTNIITCTYICVCKSDPWNEYQTFRRDLEEPTWDENTTNLCGSCFYSTFFTFGNSDGAQLKVVGGRLTLALLDMMASDITQVPIAYLPPCWRTKLIHPGWAIPALTAD